MPSRSLKARDWTARAYQASDKAAWDELVRRSRAPHFLFLRDFMDYHADRFADASLLLFRGGRLLGLLPANVDGSIVDSHAGLTFGGIVSSDEMTANRTLEAMELLCSHYRGLGKTHLLYAPVPHIYHRVPAEDDLYALFRVGARLVRRDVSSALRPGLAPRASKGRRASLARAARESFRCEESARWQEFMLIERTLLEERHGVRPVHSAAEIEMLAGRFPGSIRLFCALRGSELLAGGIVFETDRVAHAQYLAATETGRELGALDLLVDHLIGIVYREKVFFDFGISTEEQGRRLNEGLARYKESYGARTVVYDRYEVAL
jgi:hypothetical protein